MKNQTRKITLSALCIALGVVLPQAFHTIPQAGAIYSPMHIGVLLAGFIVGPYYGLIVGALTPFLSMLLTGMPKAAILPGMIFECATYAFVAGFMFNKIKVKKPLNVYVSLLTAMLLGRVVGGLVKAFIFNVGNYSLKMWVTAYFVTALPGIIMHIIILPILVFVLQKGNLIRK